MPSDHHADSTEARTELLAVYHELDRELAALGVSCHACGDCCRFGPDQPVLYATDLERQLLAGEAPPIQPDLPHEACPYLDKHTSRCLARENRTVGCRTHFCEQAVPDDRVRAAANDLCERALDRIRKITRSRGMRWDYARVVERLREG